MKQISNLLDDDEFRIPTVRGVENLLEKIMEEDVSFLKQKDDEPSEIRNDLGELQNKLKPVDSSTMTATPSNGNIANMSDFLRT